MSTSTPSSDLAVAMTACNSMRTIERAVRSVQGLAKRIVVVDSGSTDGTVEMCRSLGAEVIHQEWLGHVAQRQFSIDQCRDHEWILALDSDESLEPPLRESIRQVVETNDPSYDGWLLNRKVWFLGGWLHHTYQPEWRLRLFRSNRGRAMGENPHERIEVPGKVGKLKGDLRHDSWADLSDLAQRQIVYARQAAEERNSGGSALHLLINPPAAMFKQLILKRGFLDGWRGLIAAGMTANAAMLKHAYLAAKHNSCRNQEPHA